jgi:hypothetical protein
VSGTKANKFCKIVAKYEYLGREEANKNYIHKTVKRRVI